MSAVNDVLTRLRSALGTGESPANSNDNFIVQWYNDNVERIGRGPWCQMTVTWAFWTALPKKIIDGRAYTVWAAQDFQHEFLGSSWHWGTAGMQPGDIVYYDWAGHKGNVAYVDHVGVCEAVLPDGTFMVLEGNIGNKLQRMRRNDAYIVGYGRPNWSLVDGVRKPASAIPSVGAKKPVGSNRRPKLKVDGQLGENTIREWQIINGTPADGRFSDPSLLTRSVQLFLNRKGMRGLNGKKLVVDGRGIDSNVSRAVGPTNTIAALQRYYRTPVDGKLDRGDSSLVRALQSAINKQNGY